MPSKPIKGYEGIYIISSLGQVLSLPRRELIKSVYAMYDRNRNGQIMKQKENGTGYLYVGLSKEGKVKNYYVHRLLAEAFIPNPNNKPCINHIDGNRKHNYLKNLEWVTRSENSLHAVHELKSMPQCFKKGHKTNLGRRKEYCKRGHKLFGDNLSIHNSGKRVCRACAKIRYDKWASVN